MTETDAAAAELCLPAPDAPTTEDSIERVKKLVLLLEEQTLRVERAEEELAAAKAARLRTEREDLPELLRELGVESIVMADGSSVTVKDDVAAGITEARRDAAHAWLREHGFGGLIKSEVTVYFPPGEEEAARVCAEQLSQSQDRDVFRKEAVVPQTLTAFVREQLAESKPLPLELFGVFPYAVAKVKPPRKKRAPG